MEQLDDRTIYDMGTAMITPVHYAFYVQHMADFARLYRLLDKQLTNAENNKEELPTYERARLASRATGMQQFSGSLQELPFLASEQFTETFIRAMGQAAIHYASLRRDMRDQKQIGEVANDQYAHMAGEAGGIEQGLVRFGQSQLISHICKKLGVSWLDFDPYEPVDY